MYRPNMLQCLSFTGPYKILSLSKAGAILTDDRDAYRWLKRARFSGRNECSYLDDKFEMLGFNMYLLPEIAARGLLMMPKFYDGDGVPLPNADVEHEYPDLSLHPVYNQKSKFGGRYVYR
jgi:hypothetical protein